MVSFNRVVLAGNLTRDPEPRFSNNGIPVCELGIAVSERRGKGAEATERANFFDITAWRDVGDTIANYKKKGDPILVEGRLQFRSWEAQDGSKRSKVDVVADNVQFLGGRGDGDSSNGDGGGQRSRSGAGARSGGGGRDDVDLNEEDFDDIPFAHLNVKRLQVRDVL